MFRYLSHDFNCHSVNFVGFVWLLLFLALMPLAAVAQSRSANLGIVSDPRGPVDFVVCSQNLHNYGSLNDVRVRIPDINSEQLEQKELALVSRFNEVGCDLIAVQEVLGGSIDEAEAALVRLAQLLRRRTNRIFRVYVGESNDRFSRLGFLVAADRADVLGTLSYSRVELPKLIEGERPRMFSRGPFELQLRVKALAGSYVKLLTAVTFHFKSQRGAATDPAALDWESYRMQMAEAVRRIVEERHRQALESGEVLLVLTGDRNSNFDTASARILEGTLQLDSFRGDGDCRLSKRGVPLCRPDISKPQRYFSVLTTDPDVRSTLGTYLYKRVYSWLDDILVPAPTLVAARRDYDGVGSYASGVIHKYPDASDHGLVYVKLNW